MASDALGFGPLREDSNLLRWLAEAAGVDDAGGPGIVGRLSRPGAPGLIVYGAGYVGRRLMSALTAAGVVPAAIVDRDERLWGTEVSGVPVTSIDRASSMAGPDYMSIVAVWNPRHRFAETARLLADAGCAESIPFHVVGAELPGVLPHFSHDRPSRMEAAMEPIRAAFGMLRDDLSRETFVREIAWRAGSRSAAGRIPLPDQYFAPGLYATREDEVFVDCGAFDGDTLRTFLKRGTSFGSYHAYEPDPANSRDLHRFVETLPLPAGRRVTIREAATFDTAGEVRFAQAGDGSSVSDAGVLVVPSVRLDDEGINPPPTFIKADVEGAERATLLGAERLIRSGRPTLAICVYHRPDDLWSLPLLCRELCPDYTFDLRMHAEDGFDIVLYAVPAERAPAPLRRR